MLSNIYNADKLKLSDFLVKFLVNKGINDVFLLAGGGIMHILDALAQNISINKYYNLHEQASAFCADGYSLYSQKTSVCIVTTGPGATNTVTALASSYIDSTPIVFISGQVRTDTISVIPGVRQTGAQEIDIVSIVTPITKYAVTVKNADEILYHLEKAFFIAEDGRPGPVWIDIPLDIQAQMIELDKLKGFESSTEGYVKNTGIDNTDIDEIIGLLRNASRPVLMIGSGVRLAQAEQSLLRLIRKIKIPVVSSRRVRGVLKNEDEKFYFGVVGTNADRYANYIIQNSDFMLSVGSGLRYYITAYNESNFAPNAKRVIVNIHQPELDKLKMQGAKRICCDAKEFIERLSERIIELSENESWLAYCKELKGKYPAINEFKPTDKNLVNPYNVAFLIGKYMGENDILVTSPSAFAYAFNITEIKNNQRIISHIGLGSMGTALPEGIGACVASKSRTVICEGDGSLQHNIQELATIKRYNLPIKLFIDTNGGYRQIHTMQQTHFNGRYAGCDYDSGIVFPNLKSLAQAYGLEYKIIEDDISAEKRISEIFSNDTPMIIEMVTTMDIEYLPVLRSKIGDDGKILSPSLELLYPFLPSEEHDKNMQISLDRGTV